VSISSINSSIVSFPPNGVDIPPTALSEAGRFFNLGISFENGTGVEPNIEMAIQNYKKAADLGCCNAMVHLGFLLEMETGILKDLLGAVRLYKTAADKGDADALSQLARCYREGIGVQKDHREARRLSLLWSKKLEWLI
jgi:TPR repeat protein